MYRKEDYTMGFKKKLIVQGKDETILSQLRLGHTENDPYSSQV